MGQGGEGGTLNDLAAGLVGVRRHSTLLNPTAQGVVRDAEQGGGFPDTEFGHVRTVVPQLR